jgi:hypothetical protein
MRSSFGQSLQTIHRPRKGKAMRSGLASILSLEGFHA